MGFIKEHQWLVPEASCRTLCWTQCGSPWRGWSTCHVLKQSFFLWSHSTYLEDFFERSWTKHVCVDTDFIVSVDETMNFCPKDIRTFQEQNRLKSLWVSTFLLVWKPRKKFSFPLYFVNDLTSPYFFMHSKPLGYWCACALVLNAKYFVLYKSCFFPLIRCY